MMSKVVGEGWKADDDYWVEFWSNSWSTAASLCC